MVVKKKYINLLFETVRFILGGIFLIFGISKVSDLNGFTKVVENYEIIPSFFSKLIGYPLPFIEIIIGLLLLFGFKIRISAFFASMILVIFSIAIVKSVVSGSYSTCGCFPILDESLNTGYLFSLLRNFLLILGGLLLFFNKKKETTLSFSENLLVISLIVFAFNQIFLFLNQLDYIHKGNKIYIGRLHKEIQWNLFFTGGINGIYNECPTCDGIKIFTPKLPTILTKFEDYLYYDIGNFSSSKRSKARLNHIDWFLNQVNISAINLTKKDLIYLDSDLSKFPNVNFISSNIILEDKFRNQNNFTDIRFVKLNTISENIVVGITGLTDDSRIIGNWKSDFYIDNQIDSLNKTIPVLSNNSDFKILLYHDSLLNLKRLLNNIPSGSFDLVIGAYGNYFTEKIKFINDIPYVYVGNKAKNIGHISLFSFSKNEFFFDYELIKIRNFIKNDPAMMTKFNILQGKL